MKIKNILRRLIPKQKELPGAIGGVRMFISRIGIYLAFINWVMISRIFWSDSEIIRHVFLGSYWLFLFLGLGGVVFVALLIEWVVMFPSEIRFSQYQWAKGDRSPLYSEIAETRKIVSRLEKEISELRRELRGHEK